jgi:putative sigma-54 modulation protein
MQINLTGHHVEITPSLRDYVTGKLDKIERRNDQITNVHVILSVEKLRQKAEAKIHFSGGDIYADAEHEDMYAAIDALLDKLVRQVKRHKEKQVDRQQGAENP